MAQQTFGTWKKDGLVRVAESRAQAVKFKFEGWVEDKPTRKPEVAKPSTNS